VDDGGVLHPLAAPNLPIVSAQAAVGVPIGPRHGCCGTAAWRNEAVISTDIDTGPLWTDFKHLFLPHGIRAAWSSPIRNREGRVIGTFAFYYRTARGPDVIEQQIVSTCVHLCALS